MTTRHPIDFAVQCLADFNVMKGVAAAVLEADHGIPAGQLERVHDIAAALGRASPSLPPDVSMLVALGQTQAARDGVAAGLQTLKKIDPHLFDDAPTPRRLAMLLMNELPNVDSWASALENASLDTEDQRRRSWALFCRRMEAEGRGSQIPSETDAASIPTPKGNDGVHASKVSFPRHARPVDGKFAWEPPSTS